MGIKNRGLIHYPACIKNTDALPPLVTPVTCPPPKGGKENGYHHPQCKWSTSIPPKSDRNLWLVLTEHHRTQTSKASTEIIKSAPQCLFFLTHTMAHIGGHDSFVEDCHSKCVALYSKAVSILPKMLCGPKPRLPLLNELPVGPKELTHIINTYKILAWLSIPNWNSHHKLYSEEEWRWATDPPRGYCLLSEVETFGGNTSES